MSRNEHGTSPLWDIAIEVSLSRKYDYPPLLKQPSYQTQPMTGSPQLLLVQVKDDASFLNTFDHAEAIFFLDTPHRGSFCIMCSYCDLRSLPLLKYHESLVEPTWL